MKSLVALCLSSVLLLILPTESPVPLPSPIAKITFKVSSMGMNLDSLASVSWPRWNKADTLHFPKKTRFYDFLVLDRDTTKILAYKEHGRNWINNDNQKTLSNMAAGTIYWLYQQNKYYRQSELYENRWIDHLDVYRKKDSLIIASFPRYPPKYYSISKPQ